MSAGEGWGSDIFDGPSRGDAVRWGSALLVVLGVGWGLADGVQRLPTSAVALGQPAPAILIDLAPIAPEAEAPAISEPVPDVAPEPELEPVPVQDPPPEQVPAPAASVPLPKITTPQVAERRQPVEPKAQPPEEPEPEPAPLPEPATPTVVPPPEPEDVPVEPVPEEDIVQSTSDLPMPVMISPRLQERRENMPALPQAVARQPATPAPSSPAPRVETSLPPSPPPAARTISPQQWQAQALAQLDRRKVYPRSAQSEGTEGTVDIRFSVSAGGQITSVGIARSSGSSILDQAALDTARSASPLPPPPPDYANRALTAAIRFSLR